jgi:hypothetical protein
MSRPACFVLILVGLTGVACVREAEAEHFFHRHRKGPKLGHPRVFEHSFARAGFPNEISPHAKPTYTPDYVSYYVGGGAHHSGEPRRVEEGTWGRDYRGLLLPRHVWLGWSHGRKYQGGTGAYDPDGHVVPDVIGLTVTKIHNH